MEVFFLLLTATIHYSSNFSPLSLSLSSDLAHIKSVLENDFENISFGEVKKLFPGTLLGITLSAPFLLADKYVVERYVESTAKDSLPVKFGEIISMPGDAIFIIPSALLGYFCGYIFSDKRLRQSFLQASFNTLASTFVVQILKFSGRARPYATCGYSHCGYFYFDPPGFMSKYRSFPSGHSQVAASFYFTLGNELCDSVFCKAIFFSIPPVVAVGKVLAHDHWASDVVGGLIIGASFFIF